jgi:hypothetical protein
VAGVLSRLPVLRTSIAHCPSLALTRTLNDANPLLQAHKSVAEHRIRTGVGVYLTKAWVGTPIDCAEEFVPYTVSCDKMRGAQMH